jgi:hypothetical protein
MLTDLIAQIVSSIMKADAEIRENGAFREPDRSKRAQLIIGGGLFVLLGVCIYLSIRYGI